MVLSPQLLLQRQLEASGSFRDAIVSPQQLQEARAIIAELHIFMPTVEELAAVLKIPLENVFQCLMQIGLGSSVGFDQQARKGAVPMHQAKVLDRNALLAAQQVEPTLRKQVPEDELERLVANCQTLRSFLRMKVEDNNDFKMAHKMVRLSNEYLAEIHRLADGDPKVTYALYQAQSEDEVHALSGGRSTAASTLDSTTTLSGTASSLGTTKPLPKNLVTGLQAEISHMATGKEPVPQRQAALTTIADWLQRVDQSVLDLHYEEVVTALGPSIRTHLAEKRSAIIRLATSVVTMVVLRSPAKLIMDGPLQSNKARAVVAGWLDVLFKSVFVTVSAIANAADETIRDVIVASAGASFALSRIVEGLKSAAQAELKKKLLNYVSIVLLSTRPRSLATLEGELVPLGPILSAQLQSGDAGVRRAARAAAIIAVDVCHLGVLGLRCPALTDPKVAKALADDRAAVVGAAEEGIETFELQWIGCGQPCTASLFWHERCGLDSPTRTSVPRDALDDRSPLGSGPVGDHRGGLVSPSAMPAVGMSDTVSSPIASAQFLGTAAAHAANSTLVGCRRSLSSSRRSAGTPTATGESSSSGDRDGLWDGSAAPTRGGGCASGSKTERGCGGSAQLGDSHRSLGGGAAAAGSGLLPSIYARPSHAVASSVHPTRQTTLSIGGAMPLSLSLARNGSGVPEEASHYPHVSSPPTVLTTGLKARSSSRNRL